MPIIDIQQVLKLGCKLQEMWKKNDFHWPHDLKRKGGATIKTSTNKNNNKPLKLQSFVKTLRTLKNELDK
jgi:hypothetical protein